MMSIRVCILTYCEEAYAIQSIGKALEKLGHESFVLSPLDCSVSITDNTTCLVSQGRVVDDVQVVLTRCVGYFHHGRLIDRSLEAAVTMALIEQGAIAVNQPRSKLLASDKLLSLVHLASQGIRVPPTVLTASASEIVASSENMTFPSVIKLSEGLWGAGVMQVDTDISLRSVSGAFLNQGHPLLVQPYLLSENAVQYRVLVLGDEVLTAYECQPAKGDFRANLHAGATATIVKVSDDIADIAVAGTKALGLELAGVDIIVDDQPYVVEVNPTPGFGFARHIPDLNPARSVVDYLVRVSASAGR